MRLLRTQRIETVGLVLDDNRIRLWIVPVAPVRAETGREGILGGQGVGIKLIVLPPNFSRESSLHRIDRHSLPLYKPTQ